MIRLGFVGVVCGFVAYQFARWLIFSQWNPPGQWLWMIGIGIICVIIPIAMFIKREGFEGLIGFPPAIGVLIGYGLPLLTELLPRISVSVNMN